MNNEFSFDIPPFDSAICATVDPDLWFPESKNGRNYLERKSIQQAKDICASCIHRQDCLDWAVDHREEFGIWGGLTPRERSSLKPRSSKGRVTNSKGAQIAKLYAAGRTYAEIATIMRMNISAVHKAAERHRKRLRDDQ